jgi:hypothetical protein
MLLSEHSHHVPGSPKHMENPRTQGRSPSWSPNWEPAPTDKVLQAILAIPLQSSPWWSQPNQHHMEQKNYPAEPQPIELGYVSKWPLRFEVVTYSVIDS